MSTTFYYAAVIGLMGCLFRAVWLGIVDNDWEPEWDGPFAVLCVLGVVGVIGLAVD